MKINKKNLMEVKIQLFIADYGYKPSLCSNNPRELQLAEYMYEQDVKSCVKDYNKILIAEEKAEEKKQKKWWKAHKDEIKAAKAAKK
jgi:hypothetical protein